jgi:hypothetical protein
VNIARLKHEWCKYFENLKQDSDERVGQTMVGAWQGRVRSGWVFLQVSDVSCLLCDIESKD